MTITPTTLIRLAGAAAVGAGLIFIGVQINHPHSEVAAVTTTEWAVRNSLKVVMAALALAGITGMYLRQVRQIGLLGLLGYLLFAAGYLTIMSVAFVSAFVLPTIAGTDPGYVSDLLAAATNGSAAGDIGLMQAVFNVSGITFLGGGLLFGIALYRARVRARWAAALLAVASVRTVTLAVLPDALLPVPGLPQRHRHDRPRLLAVAHHTHPSLHAADRRRRSAPHRCAPHRGAYPMTPLSGSVETPRHGDPPSVRNTDVTDPGTEDSGTPPARRDATP